MHIPNGTPPFSGLDDYYVRSLGPRLDALLAGGYITPAMHRYFAQRVEDAKGRVAQAKVACAHSVQGERNPTR